MEMNASMNLPILQSESAHHAIDYGAILALVRRYGRRAAALSHMALRSSGELTDLVAEMHNTIARTPLPFGKFKPDAKRAPFPYRIVSGSFNTMAESLAEIPATRDLSGPNEAPAWRLFRSIANGVLGDKLSHWNNALSSPLAIHDLNGASLDLAQLRDETSKGLVLFAHGLCLSEREWNTPEHIKLTDGLRARGHAIGYIRYNSGRAIFENGRELAALLNSHIGNNSLPLLLIGHSMGGLLFRSAWELARRENHPWLQHVSHTVFLGTPHHGSPLEKVGNLANALLSHTPYTLPLMRLGNIRSRGIKDLRYGCITQEESDITDDQRHRDPRSIVHPLPTHIRTLMISAAMQDPRGKILLGDGLVKINSARGDHEDPALKLSSPKLERIHIEPLAHMALLSDARVYAAIRHWLWD
jgi:pimeloyl-ACP methyl ester carboxylesterase